MSQAKAITSKYHRCFSMFSQKIGDKKERIYRTKKFSRTLKK